MNPTFKVDTHLFRELGELLVGRDSTALVELIKNAYDADATEVTVHGHCLDDPERGTIVITDDGNGMSESQFKDGFLTIASRIKEEGDRRSPRLRRRYIGAKGVGRLAAHKLAKLIQIESVPRASGDRAISASIDWDLVEERQTLDELEDTQAVKLTTGPRSPGAPSGTKITLRRLRKKWTSAERSRFFAEVQSFSPPEVLLALAAKHVAGRLMFDRPEVTDTKATDPGFRPMLQGEFAAGEEFWSTLVEAADWIIEIDASRRMKRIHYWITPTKQCHREVPEARQRRFVEDRPASEGGPFFQARIIIREGPTRGKSAEKTWLGKGSGIRVYLEGFRVLPYGEATDDWLSINADYAKRFRTLQFLEGAAFAGEPADKDEGLQFLRMSSYFGAVFLRLSEAATLRMLVNREGFVPDAAFDALTRIVRTGVELSVRVRASAKRSPREEWRRQRSQRKESPAAAASERMELRQAVEASVAKAQALAEEARKEAAAGNIKKASELIGRAAGEFSESAENLQLLMSEGSILRVLASVGTQMAAFVHEINTLLGKATTIEAALQAIRRSVELPPRTEKLLSRLQEDIGELRRAVERQASYLTEVVSADARRRRSRQKLAARFAAAVGLFQQEAALRNIEIVNQIADELKSPPMFPAEVTVVFSNLLSNAIKAAGDQGRIRAAASTSPSGETRVRIENTGRKVDPAKGERWFRPFESTTTAVDPVLGQGMGMGLPITRNLLGEYGAEVRFVEPSKGFATAVEITFPA